MRQEIKVTFLHSFYLDREIKRLFFAKHGTKLGGLKSQRHD